jgi:hypothetical protein
MSAKLITEQVIEFCIELLARQHHKGVIKRLLASKYKITSARTAESALARARARIRERRGEAAQDLIDDSVSVYRSIIRSPRSSAREIIMAQERLDKLFGLEVHTRGAPTADAKVIKFRPIVAKKPDDPVA